MPESVIQKNVTLASYGELKRRVTEVLLRGRERIEQEKVRSYWETGRLINEHIRLNHGRAEYGKKVLIDLGRDLDMDPSVLRRSAVFAEKFPRLSIQATWPKLTWSHYRVLITIPDPKERQTYLEKAAAKEWTVDELEEKVRKSALKLSTPNENGGKKIKPLDPKLGKTGIYQIVEIAGACHLDLGFASYRQLSAEAKKFKAGDFVRLNEKGGLEKAAGVSISDIYTYPVDLLKLIDADTFWMKIHLAGAEWRKEKLRLRGLDAPELDTAAGQTAKRLTESLFKKAEAITITTTKPDKWDRYLSDVFLLMPGGEQIYLNNFLIEKKLAVRKDKFVLDDWESKE